MKRISILSLSFIFLSVSISAQNVAKQTAIKIADRILNSTTYTFKNKKTGEVYTSLKGVELTPDMTVESKYTQWHYTNGVTNIALMELGDKLNDKKYEEYVNKNMNFVFDEDNLEYFHKLYNKALEQNGWFAVRSVSWHMFFVGKGLMITGQWVQV